MVEKDTNLSREAIDGISRLAGAFLYYIPYYFIIKPFITLNIVKKIGGQKNKNFVLLNPTEFEKLARQEMGK